MKWCPKQQTHGHCYTMAQTPPHATGRGGTHREPQLREWPSQMLIWTKTMKQAQVAGDGGIFAKNKSSPDSLPNGTKAIRHQHHFMQARMLTLKAGYSSWNWNATLEICQNWQHYKRRSGLVTSFTTTTTPVSAKISKAAQGFQTMTCSFDWAGTTITSSCSFLS